MKIITIIGTRPEIIKMSPLLELLNKNFEHKIIHSGQHYDPNLDSEIFKELKLPVPRIRLKTGSGNFAQQFNKQVKKIHEALVREKPEYVIVQGDTNTALSGALVATRLKIKVVHIEAGCRSGNIHAPEEQNRIIIDAIAYARFCSDKRAYQNLIDENKIKNTFLVGSTTFDAIERSTNLVSKSFYKALKLEHGKYILATLHRAENMENLDAFKEKIQFLNWISNFLPVVFPIHPRTKKFLKNNKISLHHKIIQTPPQRHLPFVDLLKNCRLVVSDSGGIQEEAAYFNRPCLVLRQETEWTRLIKAGKNFLFTRISKENMSIAKQLISDDKFYQKVQKKRCPESKSGASRKIIQLLKRSS